MKSYDLSNVSVLVVEKHSHMRTILRQVLRQFGIANVFDAADPTIGFQRYTDCFPDIVILDWGPDFDGLGLVTKIRTGADSANPWVPVIMCTANTEKRHIVEARDIGATEYLLKPVSAKAIYDRIVSVVDDARAFVRTKSFTGPDRRRSAMPFGGEERRKDNLAIAIPKPRTAEDAKEKPAEPTPGVKQAKKPKRAKPVGNKVAMAKGKAGEPEAKPVADEPAEA